MLADGAVKGLLQKLSGLCDKAQMSKLELDDEVVDNLCSDISASLEALGQNDLDVASYQSDILKVSHDMLLLYSGNSGIEVDPVLLKIQRVFDCLKAVLAPIIAKQSDDVDVMIAALSGHKQRVNELKEALNDMSSSIKFGDKSEYFHHFCSDGHAVRECLFLLSNFGLHLSDINCETSEHVNKVLKGILVRLQGFSNRAVSKYEGHGDDNYTILNSLGYVMQEHMIRFYHHFDTFLPKKQPTHCGICNGLDHNARTCALACPVCHQGYYLGHSRKKCEQLQDQDVVD